MSGKGKKNWSDIYQFFSDNGQSKIFHDVGCVVYHCQYRQEEN
jgi:hypothetical protein